jgi:hypothetical protein
VGDAKAVMHRYVDVEALQKVTLAGRSIRAIPIRDRITADGPITTHFVSETGKYLGSESKDSGIAILPTDEKTLREQWKDANLTPPAEMKQAAPTPEAPPFGPSLPGARKGSAPVLPQGRPLAPRPSPAGGQ